MPIKTIVLDTEVFVRLKNDFNHSHFRKLKSLPKNEVYNLAITDVTRKEVESKIKHQVEEHFRSLQKFQNSPLVHRAFELSTFSFNDLKIAIEKAISEFNSFLLSFEIEVISSKSVELWDVLDLYFESRPPFSVKKKSEFPDAISLMAIEKHLFNKKGIVISGDCDWESFFNGKENFSVFMSIPELIEHLLIQENSLISLFKKQISEEITDTKLSIINYLVEDPSLIELPDGRSFELEKAQIESIEIESINIVGLKKEMYGQSTYTYCSVNFGTNITLNINSVNSYTFDPLLEGETITSHFSISVTYRVAELYGKPVLSGFFIDDCIQH